MLHSTLGFLGPIGWPEMVILAFLGLLIFGKRLPEVGKSLGKGIVQFKKGLQGIEEDIEKSSSKRDADTDEDEEDREPAKLAETSEKASVDATPSTTKAEQSTS